MPETVANIEDKLARMLGADSVAELDPGDRSLIRSLVQKTLTDIYAPVGGNRPKWAVQWRSAAIDEAQNDSVQLTQGSRTIVSTVGAGIGSGTHKLLVGSSFRTLSGPNELLTPWTGESQTTDATFYHTSFVLGSDVVAVEPDPFIEGLGPLHMLDGFEHELKIRSYLMADFRPFRSRYRALGYPRRVFDRIREADVGDPYFYWVDSAGYDGEFEQRMVLYPLPDRKYTIEYRVTINPVIEDGDTVISLPGDAIDSIFMPIAREEIAMTFPDYPGRNGQALSSKAQQSRGTLSAMARPQTDTRRRVRKKRGW